MVKPVKVWVGYSALENPCSIDAFSEDQCWAQSAYNYQITIEELKSLGWTVRPMTLLDGHGEQGIVHPFASLASQMKPLPPEDMKLIYDNLEDLYLTDPLPAAKDTTT